jgi:hypothetical protein
MMRIGDTFLLAASDLVGHLNCRNLTQLDLAVAKGELAEQRRPGCAHRGRPGHPNSLSEADIRTPDHLADPVVFTRG